jgi:hypothetical protein
MDWLWKAHALITLFATCVNMLCEVKIHDEKAEPSKTKALASCGRMLRYAEDRALWSSDSMLVPSKSHASAFSTSWYFELVRKHREEKLGPTLLLRGIAVRCEGPLRREHRAQQKCKEATYCTSTTPPQLSLPMAKSIKPNNKNKPYAYLQDAVGH